MDSRVISLFSAKGGVGKTLISLNTAVGLALKKKKTIFLDFDLKAPQGTHKLMGIQHKYCITDLISSIAQFKSGERTIENYVAQHKSGLSYLPAITHNRDKLAITPEVVRDFISLLADKYEYIVIDAGSNLTDLLITIFDLSNLILLVLTPDITSIYQVEWSIDTLQSLGFPSKMSKIILNRAESKGGISYQELKLLLNLEILSALPSEGKTVGFAVNKGVPVVIDTPNAKISNEINKLCDNLISRDNLYIKRKELSDVRVEKTAQLGQPGFFIRATAEVPQRELAEEEDVMVKFKKKVHERLLDELDLKRLPVETLMKDAKKAAELRERARRVVTDIISDVAGGFITSSEVRQKVIEEILDEALGFGPLEDLLKDPTVTEIMVNNKDQIYIEKDGKIILTSKKFISDTQVRTIIERILAPLGRRIDESVPYVDARLPDGSRVNAVISPLSLTGSTVTIRKFAKQKLTVDDLIDRFGSMTRDMAVFIEAAVKSRKNMLVSGGTGSGKTTVLNILSECIPNRERIITIEDSAELKLHHNHWLRLESRPPNIEGRGEIGIRDLFRNTLRMRPDRIIVGECRGKEVLDMLQAMNTGHDGSMSTIHANSPQDVMIRLDSMILMSGVELPLRAIREMISSAIDVIIHTARLSDGSRKITQITEVARMIDETNIELQDVFRFEQTGVNGEGKVEGYYTATGYIPSFYEQMIAQGLDVPRKIFTPKE